MFERGLAYPQEEQGELVPAMRHRAGQRAGGRRLLLAPRRHHGRAARPGAVVPAHHRLRAGTAGRPGQAARLAGESAHHAAQLDRAQRRRGGRLRCSTNPLRSRTRGRDRGKVPHARRRQTSWPALRSHRTPSRIPVFTTRIDTIFGATSLQLAPEHPLVTAVCPGRRAAGQRSRVADRRAEEGARSRRHRRDRKARRLHRALCHQSVQRRARAHLGGQLRPARIRHRRDHVGAGARRARLRIRQEIWSRDAHRRFARGARRACRDGSPTSRCCPTPKRTAC